MKVAFISDSKIKHCNDKYYSNSLSASLWRRYLQCFDDIIVCTRLTPVQANQLGDMQLSSCDKVIFSCLPFENATSFVTKYVQIKRHIKQIVSDADAVILRYPSVFANIAIKYARKFNKPYLIEMVGCPWDSLRKHSRKGKLLAPLVWLIVRNTVKNAPHVLYVSKRFLQNRYPTKGHAAGCPDVVLDKPNINVLNKRIAKINEKKDCITIGLIGSLNVGYRGHDTVIKAASELKNRGIECNIRFLGGGSSSRWLELAKKYHIEDKVKFYGTLPSGQPVLQWIDDIDILTMPTEAETLGRAVIEAMSRGCPVIGSLETAIGEQIGSDCLCQAKDHLTLAKMIERMSKDKDYLVYCSLENFYRSFKYTNEQTEKVRNEFFEQFKNEALRKG